MRLRLKSVFNSINATVTIIIVAMGLLSLTATLITGQIYHSLTLRSQMENIHQLLRQETDSSLQRVKQYTLQFSTLIINSDPFINNISHKSQVEMQKYLASLKQSPFLLSGVLNLKQINIYNADGTLASGVMFDGQAANNTTDSACQTQKNGNQSLQPDHAMEIVYDICVNDKTPYLSAVLPYVVKQQRGFAELLVNIVPNLLGLEQRISFPIRLRLDDQSIIFSSINWPNNPGKDSIASYVRKNKNGNIIFYIDAIHQDPVLDKALITARILVISGAGISIVLVILLSLLILKRTVIIPVNDVIRSIRMVREDKNNLGSQVNSRGVREVVQLADDFNAMSIALHQLYNTLETMAYTDSLTRLGNRKLFHEKLEQVIDCAKNRNLKAALLMIDLDKFKQVNDTFGHQTGDQLLVEISNRFSNVLRNSDYLANTLTKNISSAVQDHLARLGGDEFAIILPRILAEEDAVAVANKLIKVLEQPIVINNSEIDVGLSIGVALFPQHAQNTAELIHCADLAMYRAKKDHAGYKLFSSEFDK